MRKRKKYEISVIDKTYSKIISDETKFYTSDTALELVFKLKETEYTFESAEIVLLNIDDRSKVTRQVTKTIDSFTYELDDDIIAHFGDWGGQLRFEQNGETYVSSPVKFRIENDLGNDRPPQLSDVQSWVSLKRYADKLTDELKQAVLEVEGMDDTFNANELERQSTFESNESERNQTFESNELTRQTQELEREKAENNRQTTFTTNESNRTETFNTNEETRQVNETTRQQAESQRQSTFEANEIERQTTFETAEQERQSAELIRVENENQRVLTYDNLQETIDMIGKIKLVNLAQNGDFADGLTGITPIIGTRDKLSIENGMLRVDSLTNALDLGFYIKIDVLPKNHKIYTTIDLNLNSELAQTVHARSATPKVENLLSEQANTGKMSGIATPSVDLKTAYVTMNGFKGTEPYHYHVKSFQIIDLTVAFGAGNEPSKEVMDWIINKNDFFKELTIQRDDIQQYEINQLRKAVLALGGTI